MRQVSLWTRTSRAAEYSNVRSGWGGDVRVCGWVMGGGGWGVEADVVRKLVCMLRVLDVTFTWP